MTTSKEFFTIGSQGEYGVALSTVYYPSVPNSCFKANIISQRKLLKKVKTHAPQYLCDSENKITEIFERLFATWQQASVAVGQRKAKEIGVYYDSVGTNQNRVQRTKQLHYWRHEQYCEYRGDQ